MILYSVISSRSPAKPKSTAAAATAVTSLGTSPLVTAAVVPRPSVVTAAVVVPRPSVVTTPKTISRIISTTTTAAPITKTPTTSRKLQFSKDVDIFLCREVLGTGLLCKKKQSSGRVKIWEEIAAKLRDHFAANFSVRSCRERYNLLAEKFKRKNAEELRASGIAPDYDELDNLLQDLSDIEKGARENNAQQKENEKEAKEKAQGMRKRMLESMGETQEREKVTKKTRSNNQCIIDYLEKRKCDELAIRERELEVREKEVGLREREIGLRERDIELREREIVLREQESGSSRKLFSSLEELMTVQKDLNGKLSKASPL